MRMRSMAETAAATIPCLSSPASSASHKLSLMPVSFWYITPKIERKLNEMNADTRVSILSHTR